DPKIHYPKFNELLVQNTEAYPQPLLAEKRVAEESFHPSPRLPFETPHTAPAFAVNQVFSQSMSMFS
ncbi:MAG TPA: hypothetical protein PK971_16820, partial [Saprospiraceae bacterium]|nr:hypothetical protein [Saprospiraceae bacterium]HND89999.1 hypothetical protein [Saprospiraceae bacterium]